MTRLAALHSAGLLHPLSLAALCRAVGKHGSRPAAALEYAARRHPRRTAVVDESGSVTYRALAARSAAIRAGLRANGIGSGDRVGLLAQSDADGVAALFALAAERVDLHLAHPGTPPGALEHLARTQAWSVVAGAPPSIGPLVGGAVDVGPLRARRVAPRAAANEGSITVLTGGTTGAPTAASRRGSGSDVTAPFEALVRQTGIAEHGVAFVGAPLHHGFGLSAVLLGTLLGTTMLLGRRFDAASACAAVRLHRATALVVVPTMLRRMLAADPASLGGVRTILCGSAPLDPGLVDDAAQHTDAALWNLYGTSEAGFGVLASPELLRAHPGTIGAAIPGVDARVVDESGSEVPDGAVGALQLRSNAAVRPGAWTDTGDLAHREADGAILLHGRLDDLVQVGGETVAPAAVEQVLARHLDVADCAVVAVPDADLGAVLVAAVVLHPHVDVGDPRALRARIGYWMHEHAPPAERPHRIVFTRALPLTAAHKLDRRALARRVSLSP